MKNQYYILSVLLFTSCIALSGCMKNVYRGDIDEDGNPKPSNPDIEEKLPDLSVPKTFNWNEVYVKIPLSANADINKVEIDFPPLKYNKSFAYSYTFDDNVVQAYGKAFCTINKKWVDSTPFFHVKQKKSIGSTPSKPLGYTDGCGYEHRFAFGISIWPDMSNSQIDNFMKPSNHAADHYYPYLVWNDIIPLIDFGCDIYFHDINTTKYGTDVAGILTGMKAVQEITTKTIGRKMKILARPNGNNIYCTAARQYEDIVMMTVENATDIGPNVNISFNKDWDLKKVAQHRRYTEPVPVVESLMSDIDAKALSGNYDWIHDFSHAPKDFQYILDLFTAINDKYGKDGTDCIWFATLDEVYEYNFLRRNCIIEKSISNNILTLKISCPSSDLPNELMFHRDFSIILKGATIQADAKLTAGNSVYGLSYGKQKDDSWLINIDCNKSLLDKAERYTVMYEEDKEASSKEDALYFVNRLKEDLKKNYQNRLK